MNAGELGLQQTMHELVIAGRFHLLQEAENARAVLLAEGIESILTNESPLRSDWANPEASGRIRVEVRQCDAERASEILNVVADGFDLGEIATLDTEPAPLPPLVACAECGSLDFHRIPKRLIFMLVAVVLGGMAIIGERNFWPLSTLIMLGFAIIFLFVETWRCRDCGAQWS